MNRQQRQLAEQRLRVALDLNAVGVSMMRQNLRRRFPDSDAEQIEAKLAKWLRDRPLLWDPDPSAGRPAKQGRAR